jgi:hypothetical protein
MHAYHGRKHVANVGGFDSSCLQPFILWPPHLVCFIYRSLPQGSTFPSPSQIPVKRGRVKHRFYPLKCSEITLSRRTSSITYLPKIECFLVFSGISWKSMFLIKYQSKSCRTFSIGKPGISWKLPVNTR